MKTIYFTSKTVDALERVISVWLLIFVFASSAFSQNLFTKPELIQQAHNNSFRSTDDSGQSSPEKLYTLYGNDFDDYLDFYLSFNLQNRQTVRYEVVDISGRAITMGEIPDVLDQTYKVAVQVGSPGIYIVRLIIDSKYYAEKIYFK